MKMTVITTKDGAIVGAMYGQAPEPDISMVAEPSGEPPFRSGLMAGPGQELHVLDLPDEALKIGSATELHKMLEGAVRKTRK